MGRLSAKARGQSPGARDGGGARESEICLLESPGVARRSCPGLGPGALCWPEPRAPAAAPGQVQWPDGSVQLCAPAARARSAPARSSPPSPVPGPYSPVSAIAACRARGLEGGVRRRGKVIVAAQFLFYLSSSYVGPPPTTPIYIYMWQDCL